MALSRMLVGALLVFGLVFVGGVFVSEDAWANQCQCGCAYPGSGSGGSDGNGPTCRTDAECTQAACSSFCATQGPGVVPGRLVGGRVFRCVDFSAPNVPEVLPPAPVPAPAQAPVGSAPSGADTTAASPAASARRTSGGSTSPAANGSAATAPAASGATFRFELPSCTENGQCTLTDIINTGVRFANFLLAISGVVFLGTFLYAGAKLLLFAYEAKQVAEAQKMVTGAFVGIVIIMVAGVAVRFVSTGLGVSSSYTRLPGRSVPSATAPAAPGGTTR